MIVTENTFNSNLKRIRKEKGFTQEQLADAVGVSPQAVSKWEIASFPDAQLLPAVADFLGVTIDELFGRQEEKEDIHTKLLKYYNALPNEDKFEAGWEIGRVLALSCCGCREYEPLSEYILNGNFNNYSQVTWGNGFMQSRNSADLRYMLIMPEPKQGYDGWLAYEPIAAEFFGFLALPNALRAVYFLAGRKTTMFFTAKTLCHSLHITAENAREIIDGMLKFGLIWKADLNNGCSSENIYQYIATCGLVAFLAFTKALMNRPTAFNYQTDNRCGEPYFRNDTFNNNLSDKPNRNK